MASVREDMEDSRNSAVGRKRNLEEIQDEDEFSPRYSSPEDDAQRALKRVKEDIEPLEDAMADGGIVINSASPLLGASTSLPQENPRTPANVIAPLRATAWNRGVQSGLRTSFGSRVQAQMKPAISSRDESSDTVSIAVPNVADLPQRQTSTSVNEDEGDDVPMVDTMAPSQIEIPGPSEEDGKISPSSEDGEIEPNHQTANFIRQYGQDESSYSQGSVVNADSSQQQAPTLLSQDSGPSTCVFDIVPQSKEMSDQPSSSYPSLIGQNAINAIADKVSVRQDISRPFIQLSGADEARLTIAERTKYMKAKAIYMRAKADTIRRQNQESRESRRNVERLESYNLLTTEAAAVFEHEVLPFPPPYQLVQENISAGRTFFPRKLAQTPVYTKKQVQYELSEVLHDGKPIRVQDFNFEVFAPALLDQNPSKVELITQRTLLGAFTIYRIAFYSSNAIKFSGVEKVSDVDGYSRVGTTLKTAKREFNLQNGALRSVNDLPDPSDDEDISSNDPTMTERESLERELQQKYFPSTNERPAVYHCLTCGDISHRAIDCPNLTRTLCSGDHAQLACSQNYRCDKCRQRGHQKVDCPEKLALSEAEAETLGCEFCGSTDHLDVACHFIWRTFHLKAEEITKVREIPVHCYTCGIAGHYGPECGLYRPGRILSGGETWSKTNLMKYIDATSTNRAMSAGIDYSIASQSKKDFSIKGKAGNRVDVDDSDNGDVAFISEKVKKPQGRGQIKIASKTRFVQQPKGDNFLRGPNRALDLPKARPLFPDSARHGRESTFSPPPRFDDMQYDLAGSDDRYRQKVPQTEPQTENSHRLRSSQARNYEGAPQGSLPIRPPRDSHAGRGRRGSRGGKNGGGNSSRGGGSKRGQKGKGPDRGGGNSAKRRAQ